MIFPSLTVRENLRLTAKTKADMDESLALFPELEKRIVVAEKQFVASEARKKAQLSNIEKIISGRVDKYFADVCLLEQSFFRDPDKKVSQLLDELSKKVGEEVSIVRFTRFQVGETAAE
jgi:elongation factor Ts